MDDQQGKRDVVGMIGRLVELAMPNLRHYYRMTKKAKIVAINFANPSSQEELQNLFERSIRPGKSIPRHVIESMLANYKEPSFDEGFDEIIQVPFKVF